MNRKPPSYGLPQGPGSEGDGPDPSIEVQRADGTLERLPFHSDISIGRTDGDLVVPDDPFLSGRHLRLVRRWGQVVVEDLESTNGVFISISGEAELREGDEIRIGDQLFRFET